MKVYKVTILQALDLLKKNERLNPGLDIRFAESHEAPGGGEMITYNSRLTIRALQFLAHRKRSHEALVSIIVYDSADDEMVKNFREDVSPPGHIVAGGDPVDGDYVDGDQVDMEEQAQTVSRKVVTTARRVARYGRDIHSAIASPMLKSQDLTRPEVKQALSVFGRALKRFRKHTETAIHAYVDNGNTLIMDLITQYDIDTASLKHALKVACFATELASMMGFESYFGDTPPEDIYGLLEEKPPDSLSEDDLEQEKTSSSKENWSKSSSAVSCTMPASGRSDSRMVTKFEAHKSLPTPPRSRPFQNPS